MIGRTLDHNRIESKIREGGMGVVYEARDTHLNRRIAIKVLRTDKVTDPSRKQRFLQEAMAASALNHPNVVIIYDIRCDRGIDFIVMERIDGKTLDNVIARTGIHPEESLKYAVQLADGFATAHAAGILHRDLKPSNVMVTGDGGIKILDFGPAKLLEPDEISPEATTITAGPRAACCLFCRIKSRSFKVTSLTVRVKSPPPGKPYEHASCLPCRAYFPRPIVPRFPPPCADLVKVT